MYNIVKYNEIENNLKNYKIIDVRSPLEYKEDHIQEAINIPLFSNEERAHVGTLYKTDGRIAATRQGLTYVSKKLPLLYEEFLALSPARFLIYCARGGMRSESVGTFFSSLGFAINKLEGGYKAYRSHVIKSLPNLLEKKKFIVLYGQTGTGKTEILSQLEDKGADIIDLEKAANHRGSLLGAVGLEKYQSQKAFESYLFNSLNNSRNDILFVEGESKRIGKVTLPCYLMNKIENSKKIFIETPINKRIDIIKSSYLNELIDTKELLIAFEKLGRYLSKEVINTYKTALSKGNYEFIIESLIRNHYDKKYKHNNNTYEKTYINLDSSSTADLILEDYPYNT